jgi:hypothetical protein
MKTAWIWQEMIGEAADWPFQLRKHAIQERVFGFGVRSGGPAFVGASFLCDVSFLWGH